jgi:hypothetical protein
MSLKLARYAILMKLLAQGEFRLPIQVFGDSIAILPTFIHAALMVAAWEALKDQRAIQGMKVFFALCATGKARTLNPPQEVAKAVRI